MINKPPGYRPVQGLKRPTWIGGWPLVFLPLPLALKAVGALWRGDINGMVAASALLAVLYGGAWLTRRGLMHAKHRPNHIPFPFRSAGAVAVSLGTFATALFAGYEAFGAGAFGLVALFGFYLAYGFDRRTRLSEDDEIAQALEAAYAKLEKLASAGRALPTHDLRDQLGRIVGWGERILERIADDPEDFRRARKFLNVYLDGAQQVTQKFARRQDGTVPRQLEASYRTLLGDMEAVCEEQYRRLENDDIVDLDIQMEVLTTRLKREGVF
jgi:hypothetical protein